MKSRIIPLCSVIISNLLILTIAFEVLSRVFLSNYIDSKLNKIIRRYQFDRDIEDHSIFASDNQAKIPHPYLGYVRPDENNHFDIVHEKNKTTDNPIAIFGGSVAENFYHFNNEKGLLQESLKETFGLKKKDNFGLTNYAIGGYKQPQQLIATVLFRPKVKVTISIEGYNEFEANPRNQFPYYYPITSVSRLYYSGVENWDIYIKAGKTRICQRKLKVFMEKNWWFELVPTFLKVLYFMKEKYLVSLEQRLNHQMETTYLFKSPSFLDEIVYWLEHSCEQQNFLAKRGVKSYFFFQPSPYVPQSKRKLSNLEKQMVEDIKTDMGVDMKNVIEAFVLVRKIIKKENLSLNLIDMSQIFLDESREVFVDGCCHLNQLGHTLLTQKIAKGIKKTYSELEKPKLCHDDFRSLVKKFQVKFNN